MIWERRIAVALVAAASIRLMAQAPGWTYNPNHYQNNDPIW
jgi:hypothetical protein